MANRLAVTGKKPGTSYRERVALCTTTYDVLQLTKAVAAEHQFAFFGVLRLPSAKDENLAPLSVISNWPEDLLKDFDDRRLLKDYPSFKAIRNSTRPFLWSYYPHSRYYIGINPDIERIFRSFGMCAGVCLSVQDASGRRGIVSFAGDRPFPNEPELAELSYFANLVYARLFEFEPGSRASAAQKLSTRENECLMWTASGKTSSEIAAILELSEHTVNHYLTSACKKLGATNRSHAVYKAMRVGIIQ